MSSSNCRIGLDKEAGMHASVSVCYDLALNVGTTWIAGPQ